MMKLALMRTIYSTLNNLGKVLQKLKPGWVAQWDKVNSKEERILGSKLTKPAKIPRSPIGLNRKSL